MRNSRRRRTVVTDDEPRATTATGTEVTDVTRTVHVRALTPSRRPLLHSRAHIDLLRVAGALCRS